MTMPRMRTAQQVVAEIKAVDPNTEVTAEQSTPGVIRRVI